MTALNLSRRGVDLRAAWNYLARDLCECYEGEITLQVTTDTEPRRVLDTIHVQSRAFGSKNPPHVFTLTTRELARMGTREDVRAEARCLVALALGLE